MSRPIKFRIWKKSIKKYIDLTTFTMTNDGEITAIVYSSILEPALDKDNYILEQFTGLKDKNGKEIYEGDIIQEIIAADMPADGTYKYEVYWDEDTLCWSIKGISGKDCYLRSDLWETNASREVIGNIHENPELLGGEEWTSTI